MYIYVRTILGRKCEPTFNGGGRGGGEKQSQVLYVLVKGALTKNFRIISVFFSSLPY